MYVSIYNHITQRRLNRFAEWITKTVAPEIRNKQMSTRTAQS
jgi:prophage antirepressor-like protein